MKIPNSLFRKINSFNLILILLICNSSVKSKNIDCTEIQSRLIDLDSIGSPQSKISADRIKVITDFQSYQKIEDLIKHNELQGNVLYVDIWSTNCGPCLREFQSSKELKLRYKDKKVKFVYLVDLIDTPQSIAIWDSIINKHELMGYHMRMSNKFYNSINTIPGIRFIGKPHYIIVDKKGKIVYPNAERPSSKEKLFDQIDAFL